MATKPNTVKTRICIISDTHTRQPFPATDTNHAFRNPLPTADILLHAGDLTSTGRITEYESTITMLKEANAELKLVIAGNHDTSLDSEYYPRAIKEKFLPVIGHRFGGEDLVKVKELWTGEELGKAGIVYLEEGVQTFELKNGARFTIYTSPYTPEFQNWAFAYERDQDRFNPPKPVSAFQAPNPIPDWPAVDIVLTHGPPMGVLDRTLSDEPVGCANLLKAVKRCRPRLHAFGHIHEGFGGVRRGWRDEGAEKKEEEEMVELDWDRIRKEGCVRVDLSEEGGKGLRWGGETMFVNAAIMNVRYNPANAPWVVDLDLPVGDG
ncbi:hypothetical protein MMC20_004066 [Loxospora ochrophaea]|nr:hypothetical protein [Loxospora ochrophaea]